MANTNDAVSTLNTNLSTFSSDLNDISKDYQPKIITEQITLTTNSNWVIVEKSGYKLMEAISVRNDSSCFIKGINRSSNGYILIFDGITSNTDVVVWLSWAKQIY